MVDVDTESDGVVKSLLAMAKVVTENVQIEAEDVNKYEWYHLHEDALVW